MMPPRKRSCTFPNVPQVLEAGGYVNDLMLSDNCVNWLKVVTTGPVSLTGFTPGCEDRPLVVTNMGPDVVTLRQMTLSAPGRRIFCATETDTDISVGLSTWLRYDVSTSPSPPDGVWREIAKCAPCGGGAVAAFSGVRVHLGTAIPLVAHTGSAPIAWDRLDYDTGAPPYYSAGTPSLLTIPEDGYYLVRLRAEVITNWTVADGSQCLLQLYRNGVEYGATTAEPLVNNLFTPELGLTDVLHLTAGDTLHALCLQNSPNAGFIQASFFTSMEVARLNPGGGGAGGSLTVGTTPVAGGVVGDFLQVGAGGLLAQGPGGGPPTGPAGGSLGGTYPDPTIPLIDGGTW